jgi:peptidoglycan/LPS O-acetylase OafA/YrhL
MVEQRIDGIQWLRAIMSIFVVVWHLGGGGTSRLWTGDVGHHTVTLSDFINFHVLLLAVPTFLMVSSYLFARSNPDSKTALRRARHIGLLLLIWPLLSTIYSGSWHTVIANLPTTAMGTVTYVLTGGNSIYYFFVATLMTYALAFLAIRLPTATNVGLLALASVATAAAPLVAIHVNWPLLSAYWSPVNFIAYPFASVIVLRLFDTDKSRSRVVLPVLTLLILGCALSVLEWRHYRNAAFFPNHGFTFPAYTRASLIAFVMAIMVTAIHWNRGLPTVVDFMARHSLPLYLLHLFVAAPVRPVVVAVTMGMPPLIQTWLVIALTIAGSYVCAKVLSRLASERILF